MRVIAPTSYVLFYEIKSITARLFHGIIVLIVLSMYVSSVRKIFVTVNADRCYSPQEAGQN
jgi:hypothetical protein